MENNKEKEIPMLSIGLPSTLGNWHNLCSAVMGEDSSPTLFIKKKMEEQGADEPVLADERQLLQVLGQMLANDLEGEGEEGK